MRLTGRLAAGLLLLSSACAPATLDASAWSRCWVAAWRLENAGFNRDDGGSIVPVDARPDLSARGRALKDRLLARPLGDDQDEAAWAKVQALSEPELLALTDDCERRAPRA